MMTNEEMIQKSVRMRELFFSVDFPPMLIQFFDLESDALLDEKIEVLTALKEGHPISKIENFYKILELYPKEGKHWD